MPRPAWFERLSGASLDRLGEILENLNARLAEARERGWLGEVDGLEATIAGAEQKLAAMRRAATPVTGPVEFRPRRVPCASPT